MRLLCNINHVLGKNVDVLQDYELKRELDRKLKNIFIALSESTYTWETEKIKQGPRIIKPITAAWNLQIKENFLSLVSDWETLRNLQVPSAKTSEIELAACALNDTHTFEGFYHVLESTDAKRDFELHTLIQPMSLARIQDHPEDYAIAMGYTRFII